MAAQRLTTNPRLSTCPDYAGPEFEEIINDLTTGETTEAQAREKLRLAWVKSQEKLIAIWDTQLETERQAEANRNLDAEEARRQEIAKDRPNFPAFIPGDALASHDDDQFTEPVMKKMRDREWLPLGHFLLSARREAWDEARRSTEHGVKILTEGTNGLPVFVAKADVSLARNVRDDASLPFPEFLMAGHAYIRAAVQALWPPEIIQMLANFFAKLGMHRLVERNQTRVLTRYASLQRRRWYENLQTQKKTFDLSSLDNLMIREIEEDFRREDHDSQYLVVRVFPKNPTHHPRY